MKKKSLSLLVILGILTTSIMTGCGGSKPEAVTVDNKTKVKSESKVEVEFWYSGGKTAVTVFSDIVKEFNESQEVYHINEVTQADYTETYQKLQSGIAGNSAPDMALLDVDKANYLAKKDLLEDLTAFVEKDSAFPVEDYIDVYYKQGIKEDGTLFALPAYGTTQIMYYDKETFQKAGIKAEHIKTWQDLAQAAKKMTIQSNGKTTFYGWEPMYGSFNMIDAALSNGAKIFSEDGKTALINSKEWVEVWDSLRTWIHEDEIMKVHFGGQGWEYWYKTIDDVLQGRAAGYTGSSGDQADLDFTKVAAMEQPGWGENPSAPTADALTLVMLNNEDEQKKQGVFEFMKYFTSPENQAKWSMATGYVAVRKSTLEVPSFKAYAQENPQALVPLQQSMHGSIMPIDPTGGKVFDALKIAADKVEIENISAQTALDEAQKKAQEALDKLN